MVHVAREGGDQEREVRAHSSGEIRKATDNRTVQVVRVEVERVFVVEKRTKVGVGRERDGNWIAPVHAKALKKAGSVLLLSDLDAHCRALEIPPDKLG